MTPTTTATNTKLHLDPIESFLKKLNIDSNASCTTSTSSSLSSSSSASGTTIAIASEILIANSPVLSTSSSSSSSVSIFPTQATAGIKQGHELLLKMAPEIRNLIFKGLSNRDLEAFEIALGKESEDKCHTAFKEVKQQISRIKYEQLLKEISKIALLFSEPRKLFMRY